MKTIRYKPRLEAKVEGLGRVYEVEAPFDKALQSLKSLGISPISLRDLVYARIKEGSISSLSNDGSYVKQGIISGRNQLPLIVENSPLLNRELAIEAVASSGDGEYFRLQDKGRYEKILIQADQEKKKDPEKRKILILPSMTNFTISRTENFDIARGLLKDQAEKYLSFLEKDKGISVINFYVIDPHIVKKSENPIITQLWLGSLGNKSGFDGCRSLYYGCRVRGVLKKTGEASSQKIEAYTPKQIARALRSIKFSGLEKQLVDVLKQKY